MTIREALKRANIKLQPKIDDAMTKEVFEEVADEESATIYDEVYKVYKPKMYRRRGDNGGLGDPYNIAIRGGSAKNGKMAVVNLTDPNPDGCMSDGVTTGKDLPALIEYGHGYKWNYYDFPGKGKYMKPRPFTKKTIEHLKENGAHIDALRAGLRRQGIKVK